MKTKKIFATTLLASPLTSGTASDLELELQEEQFLFMPQLRRFNTIVNMAFNSVNTNFNRHDFEDRIKKYGCHCFPGSNKDEDPKRRHAAMGRGQAVDAIDSVCQKLAKCHKCVELRFPGEIDVNDGRYNPYSDDGQTLDCSNNKNAARRALCECDVEFAINLAPVWIDENHNEEFWQNNRNLRRRESMGLSTFDYDATCLASNRNVDSGNPNSAANSNGPAQVHRADLLLQMAPLPNMRPPVLGEDPDTCCGSEYIAYNSNVRSCCLSGLVAKVYDPNVYQCCDDGVKSFGSC